MLKALDFFEDLFSVWQREERRTAMSRKQFRKIRTGIAKLEGKHAEQWATEP